MVDIASLARLTRARLSSRSDSEHEQAIIRIVLIGLITIFMWGRATSAGTDSVAAQDRVLLAGLVSFFSAAIAIFLCICVWPAANIPRRIFGMVCDAGGTTFALALAGDSGVGLIGVFLFITFGNGFRYGRNYLFLCQALCLAGFVPIVMFARWWRDEPYIGWGLMCSMVLLPFYVSTLLRRIHEARAKAEEANRAKSSFLANMSHEMRTPLNGIVGVSDLLQAMPLTSEQTELVRMLRSSVNLLRALIDDVLDISKIEAGRLVVEITDFDLYATLNSIIQMMRPHATAKGLSLRATVDPAIEYKVRGDQLHLRQVLINLVANAVKFTERGHVVVSAILVREVDNTVCVRFEVADTGIGIAEAAQKRIFDQFVQADDSTTRRYGGTGLGTTIAKQLVELMGGTIGLQSRLGEGTTFWFELPLRAQLVDDIATHEHSERFASALLVGKPEARSAVEGLVTTACGGLATLALPTEAVNAVEHLRESGDPVEAVFVVGTPDEACRIFEEISNTRENNGVALIYLTETGPGEGARHRLKAIEGCTLLSLDVSARLVRNAIHAARSVDAPDTAEIIDLSLVLRQNRAALRVLIAEDNVTNQTILKQLLESAGHTVLLATNGEEALDLYEAKQPDLAILDFNMPERNGVEVTTAIRMMEPTGQRLPIVILSASVTTETRGRVQAAGADEFVGKPFDAAAMLTIIDRLGRKAGQEPRAKRRQSATISHVSAPLIDRGRLREFESMTKDPTFVGKLIRGFCRDMEQMLGRLDKLVGQSSLVGVTDITHGIKGASLGIGAQQLATRCADIDRAADAHDVVGVATLVAELHRCFDSTAKQLHTYSAGAESKVIRES